MLSCGARLIEAVRVRVDARTEAGGAHRSDVMKRQAESAQVLRAVVVVHVEPLRDVAHTRGVVKKLQDLCTHSDHNPPQCLGVRNIESHATSAACSTRRGGMVKKAVETRNMARIRTPSARTRSSSTTSQGSRLCPRRVVWNAIRTLYIIATMGEQENTRRCPHLHAHDRRYLRQGEQPFRHRAVQQTHGDGVVVHTDVCENGGDRQSVPLCFWALGLCAQCASCVVSKGASWRRRKGFRWLRQPRA
jgi:hypothetical protein